MRVRVDELAIGLEGGGGDRVGQLGVGRVGVRWVFSLGLAIGLEKVAIGLEGGVGDQVGVWKR